MANLDVLWSPMQLGPVTVKNRLVVTAHALGYGHHNLMNAKSVAYYRERALGGVGMIVSESQAIHRSSKGGLHGTHEGWRPESIPVYREVVEALHAEDCRFFVQLGHFGAEDHSTMFLDNFRALLGPSDVPSVIYGEMPKPMDADDFAAVTDGFAATAANAQIAGADGVELHSAHGYLLAAFLSPLTNIRADEYGGVTENRCRFAIEIAEAIRARCGTDFPIGFRYSFDEFVAGGIDADEGERILRCLHATGLFSYFSISGGNHTTLQKFISPMSEPKGNLLPFARRAKGVLTDGTPVITANRITSLEEAAEIVAGGTADLVAMTRAHIADPHIVRKTREGRGDTVRHCFNINQGCISRLFRNEEVTCTQNPVTGREQEWGGGDPERAAEQRKVVVVGGGPAGLKACEVAAARGHHVTLFERDEEIGGQARHAAELPTRSDWRGMLDNFRRALDAYGVTVRLGEAVDDQRLAEIDADAFVIATGSRYAKTGFSPVFADRPGIPGLENITVLDPIEAITDDTRCGERVLIVDEIGDYTAPGLGELLVDRGHEVEVVTRGMFVGAEVFTTLDIGHLYPRVVGKGVRLTPQHFITEIGPGGEVGIARLWDGEERKERFDSVVLSMTRHPEAGLYRDLKLGNGGAEIYRIGDCVSPRQVDSAVYEGEKVARAI